MRWIIILIIFFAINSCDFSENKYSDKELKAIEIAEKEFLKIYGKDVLNKKPFNLELKDSVYMVKGTLPAGRDGGVPYAIIDTSMLEIIDVYHTK